MFAIASAYKKVYGISNNLAKIFRSKSYNARNNTNMQFAIAALINALNNGHNYINSTDIWDRISYVSG